LERTLTHRTFPEFWEAYQQLPVEVQKLADQAFELLRENARHPSLQFKKVRSYYSARVGLHYRALAIEQDGAYYWFWIGHHGEYDKLLSL
jgi:hypothetical protein